MKILISNPQSEIYGEKPWILENLAYLLAGGDLELLSTGELEHKINVEGMGCEIDQIYFLTDIEFEAAMQVKEEA